MKVMDAVLELARFLTRPAFHDDFRFRVELHRVLALRVQNAEKAFLPSTERKGSHRRGNANIDADISRRRLVAELPRRRAARREEGRLVAVRALADEFDSLVNRVGMNQAQYWPENFRIGKRTRDRKSTRLNSSHANISYAV